MLAHLHASLNFAIYGLNSRAFRSGYRRLGAGLVTACCRRSTSGNSAAAAAVAAAAAAAYSICDVHCTSGRGAGYIEGDDVNTALVAVEYRPLQDDVTAESSNVLRRPPFSVSTVEEHEFHTVITRCK